MPEREKCKEKEKEKGKVITDEMLREMSPSLRHYYKNREARLATFKRYYDENRERISEYKKEWYQKRGRALERRRRKWSTTIFDWGKEDDQEKA